MEEEKDIYNSLEVRSSLIDLPLVERKSCYELQIESSEALPKVASYLLQKYKSYPLWLFKGELGSGKTSLIAALCRKLGVRSSVQSPTFTLAHPYCTSEGISVLHADLYRLEQEREIDELALSEYFYGPSYCFVEWADKYPSYWPYPQLWLQLVIIGQSKRKLILRHSDSHLSVST